MSDIWSGIGVEISKSQGDWLYRKGGEVHGPVPENAIVNKLLTGEIDLDTPVAREGGEFHPIVRVAAFTAHVKEAKKHAAKRKAAKVRNVLMLAIVALAIVGGGAGYFIWTKVQAHKAEQAAVAAQEKADREKKAAEAAALASGIEVVALVSLGEAKDVKIGGGPKKPGGRKGGRKGGRPGTKATGDTGSSSSGSDEMVSSCQRSQQQILATLGKHVRKLNVCVVEVKKTDSNMPSSLLIEFVVKPDGKVVEFGIDNRHYRAGMLRNCMFKVFNGVRYPQAKGSNCPVTLPLNIGK